MSSKITLNFKLVSRFPVSQLFIFCMQTFSKSFDVCFHLKCVVLRRWSVVRGQWSIADISSNNYPSSKGLLLREGNTTIGSTLPATARTLIRVKKIRVMH